MSAASTADAAAPAASSGRRIRMVRRPMSRRMTLLLSAASSVGFLMAWELASRIGLLDARFFPAPTAVVAALAEAVASGELFGHLGMSLSRIAVGFVIGAVPAVLLGLVMALVPVARALVQPLIDATFPIPKLAILPLFILVFGLGETSKYLVIAVTVFYIVLVNTVSGVAGIETARFEVAASFGASRRMTFFDVAFPGALPMIIAGLKLGMNVALLVIVAVEFTGAESGLGYLIWNSWQVFQIEQMYVGLGTTALLGFASAALFALLEKWLVPWKS
ncbi:ABC transporter permease [Streptomyces sp. NPDC002896]|uniref:ABC transporter permease n=1 Tax=Streptomyces sp. NPDC002896 TaxID=3154438 RepID=UPI00332B000E